MKDKMSEEEWTAEILDGVTKVPKIGSPGRVIVYGENAFPVLHGKAPDDVLIAGAIIGEGRIVVLPHGGYVNKMEANGHHNPQVAILQNTIKNWVSQGRGDDVTVVLIKNERQFKQLELTEDTVLLWKGSDVTSEAANQKLVEFVTSGGGLVIGQCPWGWLQKHKEAGLEDMPMFDIMDMAGVCFSDDIIKMPQAGIQVVDSLQQPCTHVAKSISKVAEDRQHLVTEGEGLFKCLQKLPEKAMTSLDGKLQELQELYVDDLSSCGPDPSYPVKDPEHKALMSLSETMAQRKLGATKVSKVEVFPGDFEEAPELQCAEITRTGVLIDAHPTGFYLPAGEDLTVMVQNISGMKKGWKVQVGAHTDKLHNQEKLRRWPHIFRSQPLKANGDPVIVRSPYGGLIYLISPKGESEITVTLEGVVEAPFYDLCDQESTDNWEARRSSPGLWADIRGEFIQITVPSSSVRDLEDPGTAIQVWDSVVKAHHQLRGTDPAAHRKQWVVTDEQPSIGYMHSGYPIVTHMDISMPDKPKKFLFNHEHLLSEGNWGLYHEVGHNMQRGVWTFKGTLEVTCNIFTLHAMETVSGQPAWLHSWLANKMDGVQNYFSAGADFEVWKNKPGMALGVYAQLAHHFGWDTYTKVFSRYERMLGGKAGDNTMDEETEDDEEEEEEEEELEIPKTEPQKINTWVQVFSEEANYNLCPLFELWGWPVSDDTAEVLQEKELQHFLPEDEMTELCPERVDEILNKYPECVRHP